jgi:hypothetical protein
MPSAAKLVRAYDRAMRPDAVLIGEVLRLWETPEYRDCKTAGEVLAHRAKLARN